MTQLTVEDIDDELNACIREFAEREGLTPSQAALCLLRKSVGLAEEAVRPRRIGKSLDRFVGSMSKEEADEINAAIEEMFENIDEEMWR